MNRKWISYKLGVIVMMLILVAIPVLAGCAPTAAPPSAVAKPAKVYLDLEGDLTGPYAVTSGNFVPGLLDGIKYVNDNGGVEGVLVDARVRDSGGKVDAALANYAEMRELNPRPVLIMNFVTPESEALKPKIDQDKIVWHTSALSDTSLYPPGYVVGLQPEYADGYAAVIDWLADVWQNKTGQKVKLAIITWDSPYGRIPFRDQCEAYVKKKGIEIVAREVFGMRDLDMSTQVTKAKAAGANWIYDLTGAHATPALSKSIDAMGILNQDIFDTTPGKIHHATGNWGTDEAIMRISPRTMQGIVSIRFWPSWDDTSNPGVAIMRKYFDAAQRTIKDLGLGYTLGFAGAVGDAEMMRRVVKAKGWGALTGENMRAELLKLTDYDVIGITKWSFTPLKPAPRHARMVKVVVGGVSGAKVENLTDIYVIPDMSPPQWPKIDPNLKAPDWVK